MHPLRQMAAEEQRRRRQVEGQAHACDGQEGVDIRLSRGGQPDRFGVHQLLPRQPGLRQQPPHRRIEPHQRAGYLLQYGDQPVLALHMQQFMRGNAALGEILPASQAPERWKKCRTARRHASARRLLARIRESDTEVLRRYDTAGCAIVRLATRTVCRARRRRESTRAGHPRALSAKTAGGQERVGTGPNG